MVFDNWVLQPWLPLNHMFYYALCLSYHSNTEAILFAFLSSGWATATGRMFGSTTALTRYYNFVAFFLF